MTSRFHNYALGAAAAVGVSLACVLPARSQDPAKLPPDVEKIGDELYRIGKATADLKRRTVTCSGQINMERSTIEYLAVAPGGKLHESVLSVDVRPLHLQVGLILLGLEPKGGLSFQGDPKLPKGSPVEVYASWKRNGRSVKVHAEDLVWDVDKKRSMGRKAWVFSGSKVDKTGFVADEELSLIATYRDPVAIVNNALPSGSDDASYKVNERIVPPRGTAITLTLTPAAP